MCVCVCVIFLHHSVILFYSSISLLWYVGYDDFISMSNVFVIVLIIIFSSLCCCLLIWRWIFLRNPSFQFLMNFCIFLYFFILFIICIFSKNIFFDKFLYFVFLSSGIFILSLTLIFFFVSSLSQSVGISFCDSFSFSFSFSLYHCQSLYDITRFDMIWFIV